jgi:hypothetical protein
MRIFQLFLISLCIVSCAQTKKTETTLQADSVIVDTLVSAQTEDKSSAEETEYAEDDCIYDTSSYKFTSEALKKYNKNLPFRWDKETASALAKLNEGDSLILQIGGCYHFGYSATFITDSSKFRDRKYLLQRTKWLAQNFFSNGFDEKYVHCIDNELYELGDSESKNRLFYTIIDPDTAITDHIYEGWSFEKVGPKTKIVLSGYQN